MKSFRQLLVDQLYAGLAWSVTSLVFLGVVGVAMNTLILWCYDASVLGMFNQVYAVYVFASQFAVAGVHNSLVKHLTEHLADEAVARRVFGSAMALAAVFAGLASWAFWLGRFPVSAWLQSPGVAAGMGYASPGLFLFALNKVLLAALNAEGRMKAHSICQCLRPMAFLGTLVTLTSLRLPGELLPAMFTVSEVLVFTSLAWSERGRLASVLAPDHTWLWTHLDFGIRSFLSGVLVEINMRVDLLLLGFVCSDAVVGVYTFGATLAEGFFQLMVIQRTNFNPILVNFLLGGDLAELQRFIRRWKRLNYRILVPIGILAICAYPAGLELLWWMGVRNAPSESWPVFGILMVGVLLGAGQLPFSNFLLNAGHPVLHTVMIALVVGINAVGNLWLIPIWEANGSAVATALSFVCAAWLTHFLARRVTGVSI